MRLNKKFGKNIFIALAVFIAVGSFTTVFAAETAPTFTEPTTGMQFVFIPGGMFMMGDPTGKDPSAVPAHEVTIKPFYLGKFEVTFAEYDQFARETRRDFPDDEGWGRALRPVINVSWHDAVAFAEWLSIKTNRSLRLPTETEWEYAARAGTTTEFYWGDSLGRSNSNCRGCGSPLDGLKSSAVGSFTSNAFGLFDMAGNVYEWTLDFKHPDYQGAAGDGSAWVENKDYRWSHLRVTRGGSWRQPPSEVRPHVRCWDGVNDRSNEIGFRLAMEP